ncbi:hypothetical protein [Amycolatopsis sp. lyj-108]|uniref:hypothetical protein n=1 Tax=Amycolatopsis sp. lyj-108 TaxID=2789286 RepID=UPI00397A3E83
MPELTTATWLSNVIAGAVVVAAGIALTLAGRRAAHAPEIPLSRRRHLGVTLGNSEPR